MVPLDLDRTFLSPETILACRRATVPLAVAISPKGRVAVLEETTDGQQVVLPFSDEETQTFLPRRIIPDSMHYPVDVDTPSFVAEIGSDRYLLLGPQWLPVPLTHMPITGLRVYPRVEVGQMHMRHIRVDHDGRHTWLAFSEGGLRLSIGGDKPYPERLQPIRFPYSSSYVAEIEHKAKIEVVAHGRGRMLGVATTKSRNPKTSMVHDLTNGKLLYAKSGVEITTLVENDHGVECLGTEGGKTIAFRILADGNRQIHNLSRNLQSDCRWHDITTDEERGVIAFTVPLQAASWEAHIGVITEGGVRWHVKSVGKSRIHVVSGHIIGCAVEPQGTGAIISSFRINALPRS